MTIIIVIKCKRKHQQVTEEPMNMDSGFQPAGTDSYESFNRQSNPPTAVQPVSFQTGMKEMENAPFDENLYDTKQFEMMDASPYVPKPQTPEQPTSKAIGNFEVVAANVEDELEAEAFH